MSKVYRARLSYLRQSPRKVEEVGRLIRGKSAVSALKMLGFSTRAAALPLRKLLLSALANGGYRFGEDVPAQVMVYGLRIHSGPTVKRWMPRAQGRASPIHKRTTHVDIELVEKIFA